MTARLFALYGGLNQRRGRGDDHHQGPEARPYGGLWIFLSCTVVRFTTSSELFHISSCSVGSPSSA